MKRIPFATAALLVGCLFITFQLRAAEITVDLSAGYDDNAAEVPDGDGSGVVRYLARWDHSFQKEERPTSAAVFLEGSYGQYLDLEDHYLLRAGGRATFLPPGARFQPGVFGEAACYRDDLVGEDDYNRYLFGAMVQWLADARLSLALRQLFAWTDYPNKVSAPGERSTLLGKGDRRGRRGNTGADGQPTPVTYSRTDTFWTTRVDANWFLSPAFQADLSFHYKILDATAVYESHQEVGGLVRVLWSGLAHWAFSGEGHWAVRDYENAPEGGGRTDDYYGAGFEVVRSFQVADLFFRIDWIRNDSPLAGETYDKMATLCGATFTY